MTNKQGAIIITLTWLIAILTIAFAYVQLLNGGLTVHLWEDGSYYASFKQYDMQGCLPLAICND